VQALLKLPLGEYYVNYLIIIITISSNLSGTAAAVSKGKEDNLGKDCPVVTSYGCYGAGVLSGW
jgi:hypothetical protein